MKRNNNDDFEFKLYKTPQDTSCGYSQQDREDSIASLIKYDVLTGGVLKVRAMKDRLSSCMDFVDTIEVEKNRKLSKKKDKIIPCYVFGKVDQIKFSYKESVLDWSKGKKEFLGGAYGIFNDGKGTTMLLFEAKLYKEKKRFIENLGGQYVLAECIQKPNIVGLTVKDVWSFDELSKAKGFNLNLKEEIDINEWHEDYLERFKKCEGCDSRVKCKAPVPLEPGKYNYMIVAESPGRTEDDQNRPLVGDSGRITFEAAKKFGLKRKNINISNLFKCRPLNNKLESCKNNIKKCRHWLDEEIKEINPFVILSMGGYARKFFTNSEEKIMASNASVEWNGNYGCWIVYSIHPASTLYDPNNKKMFNDAMKVFANIIEELGG